MSLKPKLEAIIYAAETPITLDQIVQLVRDSLLADGASDDADVRSRVRAALDELFADYGVPDRGIEIRQVAGGYRMSTKPEQHDVVRAFAKSLKPPIRLSMPALETLAVIAYKQPVTGPEISEIRGVNSSGVIATLLDKRLITTAGRKEVMGRTILYKSSKEFLMRFGLSDLQELPSLKEFEALAREALGSDVGIAPTTEEAMLAEPTADTLENLTSAQSPTSGHSSAPLDSSNPLTADLADNNQLVPTEFAAPGAGAPGPGIAPGSSASPSDEQFLRDREVESTAEGMPSGELDEEPP